MLQPYFFLQIVDANGVVAKLPGGGQLEKDLVAHVKSYVMKHLELPNNPPYAEQIEMLTQSIIKHRVGFWTTKTAVELAIRKGLTETVQVDVMAKHIEATVEEAIYQAIKDLKEQTKFAV